MPSLKSSGRPKRPKLLIRSIQGSSMLPAFKPGHLVVASGLYRKLRRGDVVIIGHGGLEKIKRITGMSNDLIFVEGDNPAHSTDSRSFGWLQASAVVAKVIWPK